MIPPAEIWRRLGGGEPPPTFVGKHTGPLLVIGTARCVWDDLDWLGEWPGDAMCVNDVAEHYQGRVRHLFSLYPDLLQGWRKVRRHRFPGVDGPLVDTHSHRNGPEIDRIWPPAVMGGTSGLGAALAGLMLGYAPVLLAGTPIANIGHYYDPPGAPTGGPGQEHVRLRWIEMRDTVFHGRVLSLSGWTREVLGTPAVGAASAGLAVIERVARMEAGLPAGTGP